MKKPLSKPCEVCGDPFDKPSDTSVKQWSERKYCSRLCAAKTRFGPAHAPMVAQVGIVSAMAALFSAMQNWRRAA